MGKLNQRFTPTTKCSVVTCKYIADTMRCIYDEYGKMVWLYLCKKDAEVYDNLNEEKQEKDGSK